MMRPFTTVVVLLAACLGLSWLSTLAADPQADDSASTPQMAQPPMLVHNVYFALTDNSPAARKALVRASYRDLAGIPGIVFFTVGTPSDQDRPVNDRDFDVALHSVFRDEAALLKYLEHPKHVGYVEKHQANWKKVRVFDSDVCGAD